MWGQISEFLFPVMAEREEAFRQETLRLSRLGLLIVGWTQIGLSLFMLAARFFMTPSSTALPFRARQALAITILGIINVGLARFGWIKDWSRSVAAASGLITVTVTIWSSLLILSESTNPDDFIPGQITLVMLVAVTLIPFQPMHTFAFGMATCAIYVFSTKFAQERLHEGSGPADNYVLFIFMLTLLATAITGVVYRQRHVNFKLRAAETRALLAENASSLASLAAAISHELNNPMGALLSGVDTLLLLASKQATCTPQEQGRLVMLQADIRRSIQTSAERLRALVARMQRFTNLDQAEVQAADLNELVADVAALATPQLPKTASLELDLQPLEPLVCRPQQISGVFNILLSNALNAIDGTGRVVISTRQKDTEVEVAIHDNGRGVPPKDLERIFEPGFKIAGERVGTGNWSMFSSRQIVREHGGEIRIASDVGRGTTVTVTFAGNNAIS